MDGSRFLDIARELLRGTTEAHWRTAAGRAYYALMLESRDLLHRWSFAAPPRDQVHAFVRLRFSYAADPDLKEVGRALEELGKLRNQADYQLAAGPRFSSVGKARQAVQDAENHLALLKLVDADLPRRTAVITDIRAKFP